MTIYVSESEMLDRYIDGLKRASSRAREFVKTKKENRPKLFVDFIDSIKMSAGSAHQLFHARANPKWLDTRDILEGIIEVGKTLPVWSEDDHNHWIKIAGLLDQMVITGSKLAVQKDMTWNNVLANLDHRAKNAGVFGKKEEPINGTSS